MPLVVMSSLAELSRRARRLKLVIDEELRGWSWDEPPILNPYHGYLLPISDVYNETCTCGAYVYLKHIMGRKIKPVKYSPNGEVVHHLWTRFYTSLQRITPSLQNPYSLYNELTNAADLEKAYLIERLRKEGYQNAEECVDYWIKTLWNAMTYMAVSEYIKLVSSATFPPETITSWLCPLAVELRVDGTNIGFSGNCRLDALSPSGIIIEIKTTKPKEIHKLALAAYALTVEACYEIPIDYGLLIYIHRLEDRELFLCKHNLVPLENKLRIDAVEHRDKMLRIVHERVFKPPTSPCSASCPLNMEEIIA